MKSGVYQIDRVGTGKVYVGSSQNITHRWACHRRLLRYGSHENSKLQRAWNKHGEAAFQFTIVEECPVEALIEREQHYIDALHPFYNLAPMAGSVRGWKQPEYVKQIVSARQKGNTHRRGAKHTPETRMLLAARQTGKTHSEDTRRKMSQTRKGRTGYWAGRTMSEESNRKRSAALKGVPKKREHTLHWFGIALE